MKIKMTNANTADNATLKIGSETAKPLWYNDERASSSNTWEENEVISVYYDGTYYQASNAMGGGSATGKKKLTGILNTVYDTVGDKITSPRTANNYQGIKYPVQAGDVVLVSGTGGASALLWAIAGTQEGAEGDDNILDRESPSATRVNKVLVMPENAHWVVLNSTTANAEWYYAKKGSVGAHEILTEAYLYEDLRTLEVGQTFRKNEAVKTADKQLLKMTKDITIMSLTDEVAQGDLRANGNNTYQAQAGVSAYSSNNTYADGDCAVGSPSGAVVEVEVDAETVGALTEAVDITVTIVGVECAVSVTSEDDAASIAGKIHTSWGTQDEWNLTDNEDGTLILISKIAKGVAPTITSEVGESGVTIGFVADSSYAGSLSVSSFDGDEWTEVANMDEYIESGIWESMNASDLLQYTVQNTWASYLQVEKSVSSNPYTLPSKQSLMLYRGLPVKKGRTYTVYLKSAESLHHSYVTVFLLDGNQEVSNTVRFESTTDIKNGVIAQLTATQNTNANLYLYEGTGTWTGVELECKVTWVDDACSIEEKVKWEEDEDKNRVESVDDYPYRKVSKTIPYVSTGYIYANWGDKFGTIQTKTSNYHITDYIECAGATKLKYPQQIASNLYIGLVFYDSEHSPILDHFAHCRYRDEVSNPVYKVIDVPENAAYFRNSTWDGGEEYTLYYDPTLLDITAALSDITSEVNTIEKTKMDVDAQLVKMMTLARYSGTDGINSLGLVHFSDLHGDTIAATELRNFISKYGTYFDDVIETGDTVYQYANDRRVIVSPESLFVLGNHDGAANGGTWEEGMADWDGKGKVWDYGTYFEPYFNAWGVGNPDGVHMPEGHDNPESPYYKCCFWYKDYAFANIRLIGLDCIHRYDGRSDGSRSYLTREQEDWFADTLEDARTNEYKVIVACHYGLDDFYHAFKKWDDTNHVWKYNFITEESKTNDSGHDGGYVMNSMTNRKSSFHAFDETFAYEKKFCLRVRGTKPTSAKTNENIFGDILSEWIDNGGEFIAWISGHTHRDMMFYSEKYPNVLNVVIDRAGTGISGTNLNRRYDGTNQRLAANLYYVRENAFIIVRIGYNMTNNLEPLGWTAINYKTGQIISQG